MPSNMLCMLLPLEEMLEHLEASRAASGGA